MAVSILATQPIAGQKPGTSGLRKKTRVFMQSPYLENYVQAIFDGIGGVEGKSLVIGGDGRYFNEEAIGIILRMAAANGVARCIVGCGGLLSTPAASHLIRLNKADGGLILSASHNPGGIDADFGLKFNGANGGPATETVSDAIYTKTQTLKEYRILQTNAPSIHIQGEVMLADMRVSVIDPIEDYAELMQSLFDFSAISALFKSGFTLCFDAMHAITGPYAQEIFEKRLGAPIGSVINGIPAKDFNGGHPDPNPIWATELMQIMYADTAPDFGAASDGDGDRNMILGKKCYVSPSDSLAVLADKAHLAPGYAAGLQGIARSMPTSAAADRVAQAKGIPCYETPTGWKFFGNLLDADKVTLCGEESAGTGSNHVREKDGLWAILLWLNIIACTHKSVTELLQEHWQTYGRNYYSRHDYEEIDTEVADTLFKQLRESLPGLAGQKVAGLTLLYGDEFSYDDPIDGSRSVQQGIRIFFENDARVVFRLSGTGTSGATLRVYLEKLETRADALQFDPQVILADVIQAANTLAHITTLTGRTGPDVIS